MAESQKKYLVIKIGGRPAADLGLMDELIKDLAALKDGNSWSPILVHGGGSEVSEMSRKLGLEPTFVGGIRQTSPAEMDVVEMVLAGSANTRLLRRFYAQGLLAVGLGGADAGLFIAESIDPASNNRTGRIIKTDTKVLEDLCALGYVPVLSSVSSDPGGSGALNINADDAAMALAIALGAGALLYLSDIAGILRDGQVMSEIDPARAETEIASGVIGGGMIPKVRSSLGAVEKGVGRVVIGGFAERGDLTRLLNREKGTSLHL